MSNLSAIIKVTNNTQLINDINSKLNDLSLYVQITNQNLDDFFFVVCGILVLFMQVGFACLEAGSITSKNVTNIMLKNFLDSLICVIMYWLIGWGIAFGEGNEFLGWTMFAGIDMPNTSLGLWFFQYTFASTASTILSGAVAERCSFICYLSACCLISGFIYPVVVHWTWNQQGWLFKYHFDDFSGGMIIHGVSGTVCLISTIMIGPRINRFDPENDNLKPHGHSTALTGIGAIIIMVGFCGFNAGTINHYSKQNDGIICAKIVINTLTCGAGGALCVLIGGKCGIFKRKSRWPFSFTVNGGIAGLVTSCASCNVFTNLESLIAGFIAGIIYIVLHHLIIKCKIDDPLDSSPIHLGSGIWSVISLPLLKNGGPLRTPLNVIGKLLYIQLLGVIGIMTWVSICSIIFFGVLHMLKLLRASDEEEFFGLDIAKHGEPAYETDIGSIPQSQIVPESLRHFPRNSSSRTMFCSSTSF